MASAWSRSRLRRFFRRKPDGKSGIGIKNVNDRLKIWFGEKYGITITSVPDEGTCVTVRMPKVRERANMRSIKRLAALLLTMVMLALSGCTAARTSGPYSVYLISKSSTTEFWKSVFAGANAAKSEYNVDLTILAPETEEEYEVQNDYIRQAIESRADAIVFSGNQLYRQCGGHQRGRGGGNPRGGH